MSKYISKENLNHIVQEMGKKVNIIDDLTNEEVQEIIDAFEPEFVPEDEDKNVGGVPLAAIIPWVDDVNTVPAGFLKCDGTAVSRTDYADLFGAIGTKYGSGDGSTTFNTPDLTDAAILNGSYDKTVYDTAGSATFTAPKDGYYKITAKGGGGGGGYSSNTSGQYYTGGGGGEGGTSMSYEKLTAGDTVSIVIGGGGAGATTATNGSDGGNTSYTIDGNTTTAYGGEGGAYTSSAKGKGGDGNYRKGFNGEHPNRTNGLTEIGSDGGGYGGGLGVWTAKGGDATANTGCGGAGGSSGASNYGGGNGADGFVTFEYIGTASQYLIKYTPTVIDSEVSAATSASQAQAAAQAAESYAGSAGIPVGTLFPYAADTNTPPTGFLFCNGQAVSRTMYADLFSVLGTTWGAGDGSTTFNLPTSEDLVLQGASATNPVGTYKTAGLPNIEGETNLNPNTGVVLPPSTQGGAFIKATATPYGVSGQQSAGYNLGFDASQSNAIYGNSDTVQPPAACVKIIIKAYDGVTPTSAGIDLSQYASDLSNKASRGLDNLTDAGKDRFLGDDNFAIIYPNGGTAANPANVAANTRYVETNPFPGYYVRCIPEIYWNNEWGNPEWFDMYISALNTAGVRCNQLNDSNIVIQTGNYYVMQGSINSGNPFGTTSYPTSAPCRVKVWKIGKIPA